MRDYLGKRRSTRTVVSAAALRCAAQWHWPVLPGAQAGPHPGRAPRAAVRRGPLDGPSRALPLDEEALTGGAGCACLRPGCRFPGAHPLDPPLLAATDDPAMVRFWWRVTPHAPLLLATGRRVSAVSLPLAPGREALRRLTALDVSLGPVIAAPDRLLLLVQPYSLEQLGELLNGFEWVPASVRFHGEGGYVVLPPSRTGGGPVRWARRPVPGPGGGAPWLPSAGAVLDSLVEVAGQNV